MKISIEILKGSLLNFLILLLFESFLYASAPLHVPLGYMIGESEAIVIGKVVKIEPSNQRPGIPTVWSPSGKQTVQVIETLRGITPEYFKIQFDNSFNKDYRKYIGLKAIVFIGKIRGRSDPIDGTLPIFEAAQGFVRIDKLLEDKDSVFKKKVVDSIRDSISAHQDRMDEKVYLWPYRLYDYEVKPFIELLYSESRPLKYFAIKKALDGVLITPLVGSALMRTVRDIDREVSKLAAQKLIYQKYRPADNTLRRYSKRISKVSPKISNQVLRYLYFLSIEDYLQKMDREHHEVIRQELNSADRKVDFWAPYSQVFLFQKNGEIQTDKKHSTLSIKTLDILTHYLTKFSKKNTTPLKETVTIYLYTEKGQLRINVYAFIRLG